MMLNDFLGQLNTETRVSLIKDKSNTLILLNVADPEP